MKTIKDYSLYSIAVFLIFVYIPFAIITKILDRTITRIFKCVGFQ